MWNVNQEISANRYRSKILQSDLWLGSCEYIKESLETRQAIELCNMLELNKSTFKFPGFAFAFLFALTFDLISEFTGHGCLLATVLLIDLLTICFAHHLTLYCFWTGSYQFFVEPQQHEEYLGELDCKFYLPHHFSKLTAPCCCCISPHLSVQPFTSFLSTFLQFILFFRPPAEQILPLTHTLLFLVCVSVWDAVYIISSTCGMILLHVS